VSGLNNDTNLKKTGSPVVWLTVIALLGVVVTAITFQHLKHTERQIHQADLYRIMDHRVELLDREIEGNLRVLESLWSLFVGSSKVEYPEFAQVAEKLTQQHKSIQALEWIPQIDQAARAGSVRSNQIDFPGFQIRQANPSGRMVPAGEREFYYPVYYVYPMKGNERALGFDLGSNTDRLKTIIAARDSGNLQLTAPIKLVQETSNSLSVLAFQPLYRNDLVASETLAQGLRGFLLGVYRIDDMVGAVRFEDELLDVDVRLLDRSDDSETVLFESAGGGQARADLRYLKRVASITSRQWYFEAVPSEQYFVRKQSNTPYIAAAVSLLLTLGVMWAVYILIHRSALVESEVKQRTHELHDALEKLEEQAVTDGLTGIANRRQFNHILETECRRAIREFTPVTLMMVDVDCFKAFNDTYGHAAGDDALRQVARVLDEAVTRPGDLVARYGGEEFALLLPATNEQAEQLAIRCLNLVEALGIAHSRNLAAEVVTISIGLATLQPTTDLSPGRLIEVADQALYQAKEGGRNRHVAVIEKSDDVPVTYSV